jgi:predicted methyltransferase
VDFNLQRSLMSFGTMTKHWRAICGGVVLLCLAACASHSQKPAATKGWTTDSLRTALAVPSRPQADRDRDADRKPAELMTVIGVKPGMTAVDVIAAGGYLTEVLSIAVGPTGKVYMQNPAAILNGPNGKAVATRVENNRLPNVVRLDGDLPGAAGANSADVAVTAMNLHDVYNRSPQAAQAFVKSVYDTLKPGGVFGVVDHVGVAGADNAKLHRMQKQQAIDVVTGAGFKLESDSNVLAHPADDHTKAVFDPTLRGKTDQFTLVFRKPK